MIIPVVFVCFRVCLRSANFLPSSLSRGSKVFRRFCRSAPCNMYAYRGVLRSGTTLDTIDLVDAVSEPRNEHPFGSHRETARPGGFFVSAISIWPSVPPTHNLRCDYS